MIHRWLLGVCTLQITGQARLASVARGALDYIRRCMMSPEGGIYSAEVRA